MKVKNSLMGILMVAAGAVFLGGCSMPQHYNENAAEEEKASVDVIPYLGLKKGQAVADLGAGGGYFSFKLAAAVGETGLVFAVDVDPESIEFIQACVRERGIKNIRTVLASFDDSKLEPRSVDLVFMRDAYHDFQNRVEYFKRLKKVLKPGGRIAIIDYDPKKLGFLRKLHGHDLDESIIIEEMRQAGYVKKAGYPILKKQSFNIFGPE